MAVPSAPGGRDDSHHDDDPTQQYLDLIRSLHRQWADLEQREDASVQLSGSTRSALSEAVRADTRHGAQVQMPPTDLGPYTLTELALRTLIREAIDSVAGSRSLRTALDYGPGPGRGTRGSPTALSCRISAAARIPDLLAWADSVRSAVVEACARELDLSDLVIDIHIEDLHDY